MPRTATGRNDNLLTLKKEEIEILHNYNSNCFKHKMYMLYQKENVDFRIYL